LRNHGCSVERVVVLLVFPAALDDVDTENTVCHAEITER
jgi:hypothetical protein